MRQSFDRLDSLTNVKFVFILLLIIVRIKNGGTDMKSLNTIQTISKIAKVFSSILFVFSIVGFCLCIVALFSSAYTFESFKLGGVNFDSILQDKADLSESMINSVFAQSAVIFAGTIVVAKLSELYFKHELKAGTPFTFDGAKELMRLGIISVCITIGTEIISSIVNSVFAKSADYAELTDIDTTSSVTIGIALIFISILCRYGAELAENNAKTERIEE